MFFIKGIRMRSPSANHGVVQTEIDVPLPTMCRSPLMRRSRPYRILLQAYDGREPNFAVRKLPLENYRLFKKVENREDGS